MGVVEVIRVVEVFIVVFGGEKSVHGLVVLLILVVSELFCYLQP